MSEFIWLRSGWKLNWECHFQCFGRTSSGTNDGKYDTTHFFQLVLWKLDRRSWSIFIKLRIFLKENTWHCENCTSKICDYKCHNLELVVYGCPKNIWLLAYFFLDGNIDQAYYCYHETYYHRAAHEYSWKNLLEDPTMNIHVGVSDTNETTHWS